MIEKAFMTSGDDVKAKNEKKWMLKVRDKLTHLLV
jgi:hypothetical protein